jgi:hypothetical protein
MTATRRRRPTGTSPRQEPRPHPRRAPTTARRFLIVEAAYRRLQQMPERGASRPSTRRSMEGARTGSEIASAPPEGGDRKDPFEQRRIVDELRETSNQTLRATVTSGGRWTSGGPPAASDPDAVIPKALTVEESQELHFWILDSGARELPTPWNPRGCVLALASGTANASCRMRAPSPISSAPRLAATSQQ